MGKTISLRGGAAAAFLGRKATKSGKDLGEMSAEDKRLSDVALAIHIAVKDGDMGAATQLLKAEKKRP